VLVQKSLLTFFSRSAFVLLGDMKPSIGALYVLSQCLGAILGAAILWGCTASQVLMEYTHDPTGETRGEDPPFLLGLNVVNTNLPLASAFLIEFMGTFLLVWTVLMTAVYKNNIAGNLAPIAIGWSVFLAHVVLIPFTGCGINPARSLGPMLVVIMSGQKVGFEGWWIFYTAPFLGSAVAALICKYLFGVFQEGNNGSNEYQAAEVATSGVAKKVEKQEEGDETTE
jgi:glycerol uptake facilitator-like aquaporin